MSAKIEKKYIAHAERALNKYQWGPHKLITYDLYIRQQQEY